MCCRHILRLGLILIVFSVANQATYTPLSVYIGEEAVLSCGHDPGNSLIVLNWIVELTDQPQCTISYDTEDNKTQNNCSKRIKLDNLSLHIFDSKPIDDGFYRCEISDPTGVFSMTFTLQVLVQPSLILELNSDGHLECLALGGNPAANISWSPEPQYGNTTEKRMSNMTWATVSTYTKENISVSNMTCVISHPTFAEDKFMTMNDTDRSIPLWVVLATVIFIISTIILGWLIFWQRSNIRKCLRVDKPNTASVNQGRDNAQQNTEEVEPYASFTQKINTIYNSTPQLSKSDKIYWTVDNNS
ncbi:cell surface glycoprotein CD200 receptor 2-like isoform X1 [Pelobates fuscus]|uniref:cell surface glycoprotein CD200 receptor 2-like isoform X1 n=1 Tax=Pelobates fuscus TaxID=191477 RepID=UPI002FE4892A